MQPFITFLLFVGILGATSFALQTDPTVNLWSVGYLWQSTGHTLFSWQPTSTSEALPANHTNGLTWQARAAFEADKRMLAEQLAATAVARGSRDAWRLQAEIRFAQGNYTEAYAQWAALGDAEALLEAGQSKEQQGKGNAALAAYQAAYTIAPERTTLPLAHYLWESGQKTRTAEQLLVESLKQYPGSRYSYAWLSELGAIYQHEARWDQAAIVYQELVTAAPDRVQDQLALGWVYYERGDGATAALPQFEQVIARAPQLGDGYYAIGALLSREKRPVDADPWYRQALERNPDQMWWYLSWATARQEAKELPAAIELYQTIQQRFPTFAQGHLQAAWAYRQAEEREAALTAIEQALRYMQDEGRITAQAQASYYIRAGQIYEWAGQLPEAVAAYEQAAQRDPARSEAQEGLQRLR